MIRPKKSLLRWELTPTYQSALNKVHFGGSMYHMMFYCWTNDGHDTGQDLNTETFRIYANIVASGTYSWMKY